MDASAAVAVSPVCRQTQLQQRLSFIYDFQVSTKVTWMIWHMPLLQKLATWQSWNYVFPAICLNTAKTYAARITKLDTEMFHDQSWSEMPLNLGSEYQRPLSPKHCRHGSLHSLSAEFF